MIHRSGIVDGKRVYETMIGRPLPRHATDLEYQISSCGGWLPGVYDSERAARYAFRFTGADLQALQDAVNARIADPEQRVITFEMLQEYRRAH